MVRVGRRQAAFVFMDIMMAMALLGAGVMVSLVFFRTQVREVRTTHEHLSALLIAESEIERLRATPFSDIPVGEEMPLTLTMPSAQRIKGIGGTLTVTEPSADTKEATVRIEWESAKGRKKQVEVTSWRIEGVLP